MVRALFRSLETPGYTSLSKRHIHGPNSGHRQSFQEERQNHFWRQNPLCPEMGGAKTTVACWQALHLWAKRVARERTRVSFRVLLSRDFSRLSQMESLITTSNRDTSINLVPRAFPLENGKGGNKVALPHGGYLGTSHNLSWVGGGVEEKLGGLQFFLNGIWGALKCQNITLGGSSIFF